MNEASTEWFAMRDLKRRNALQPAWKMLSEAGFDVFTPMKTEITTSGSRRRRLEMPCIPDLLFVRSTRADLDPVVAATPTLQYRFMRGALPGTPMTVRPAEMHRFITAVNLSRSVDYFTPDEITPAMLGRRVRLICDGPLDGLECNLLAIEGTPRRRRVLITLPGLLTAAVTLSPSYLHLLPT